MTKSPTDDAIRYVCAKHLHQVFWLPATSAHPRLRITFSTSSNIEDATLPTVLFCGPMVCTRYHTVDVEYLARTEGVRVITLDRPSFGGSTPVPTDQRISVYLEAVPVLLSHLNIKYINILGHSAGTMFALNVVYHLRHLLDPEHPYVAMLGPYVDSKVTEVKMLKAAAALPNGLLGSFDSTMCFINQRINPVAMWSGSAFTSSLNLFQAEPANEDDGSISRAEKYGVESDEIGKEIERLVDKFMWAEETKGLNEEARLCLKKKGSGDWGVAEDYMSYVRELIKKEKETRQDGQAKLKIDIFFAASDMMSGKRGQEYFEACWQQDGVADVIDCTPTTLPDTNHESIITNRKKGALTTAFKRFHGVAT